MSEASETQRPTSKPARRRRSRADTEQKLIDVALETIREKGVLAGLNLREVANSAGVNRGNIYHYFGSRQDLLRAAINRQFDTIFESFRRNQKPARFVQRRVANFLQRGRTKTNDSHLRALLVLDGDNNVDPIPMYARGLRQLRQDVIDGEIHRDYDLDALQVALSAFTRGYRIFRAPYARRVGIAPTELDQRVSRILRTWLTAMAEPPPK
ncbi:MAG: TetR family transcriptional regulator [Proteobacteria bacterium]|nr:TetR family transcriptional regulator [Pseudomonadota bacterium]